MMRRNTESQNHNKPVEPLVPALALTVEDAAKALAIGRTSLFYLLRDGRLRSVKIGSRTVIPVRAIEDFLAELGGAA
jgi:excisionase family DNA binding protein